MAKQTINLGTAANARNGDPIRTAFLKVNANFDELYESIVGNTVDTIKDTAAEMLVNGVHDGITVNYNNISKVINLSVTTSAVLLDMDGGAAATVYAYDTDGGTAATVYNNTPLDGGGA